MTATLAALAATVLIHLTAVFWSQRLLEQDVGRAGNLQPRDGGLDLSPRTQRLRRALANHTENIGPFIIAVLLVHLTGSSGLFSAACAWLFVIVRALYLPAYANGWVPWRSYLYMAGLLATLALLLRSFFG